MGTIVRIVFWSIVMGVMVDAVHANKVNKRRADRKAAKEERQ
jgi:hypothetical protein